MGIYDALREIEQTAQTIRNIQKQVPAAKQQMSAMILEMEQKDYDILREAGANKFYSAYPPKFYSRTNQLKEGARPQPIGLFDIEMNYDPGNMPAHARVGGDWIYEQVFEGGFHGGNKRNLIPVPKTGPLAYDGGSAPYSDPDIPLNWIPAPKSTSPKEEIEQLVESYDSGGTPEDTKGLNAIKDESWDATFGALEKQLRAIL